MEPLTAVGLAGNITQFVDFGLKLFTSTREIYKGQQGASENNVVLTAVTSDLKALTASISSPTPESIPPEIRDLADNCKKVSDRLLAVLKDLQASKPTKWKSFLLALRQVRKRDEIEALRNSLEELQRQLSLRLLASLRDQQAQMSKDVSDSIARLRIETKDITFQQEVLRSLAYEHMESRRCHITDAHSKTFSWIFEESADGTRPTSFHDWLSSGSGIYWIRGKAASGKSTLMKYICDHDSTIKALTEWAHPKQLVTASFFFWLSGAELQKSQYGLLRSLLFEILSKSPNLIREEWRKWVLPWSPKQLLAALEDLSQRTDATAKFCFFIDGLDEYNGDSFDLIPLVERLASCSDIKICVSSRPWREFSDAFEHCPQMKLEDLTRADIRMYVENILGSNSRFLSLKATDEAYDQFVSRIVHDANGVFLWVVFAVKSLLRGLTFGDTMEMLHKRLRDLPKSLEEIFSRMMDSVDPVYRIKSARMFLIALHQSSLSLICWSLFFDIEQSPDEDYALTVKPKFMEESEIVRRQEETKRVIDGLSKGLLEVVNSKTIASKRYFSYKVEFLHRTVVDFLREPEMNAMMKKNAGEGFDVAACLCSMTLMHLKLTPDTTPESEVADNIFDLIERANSIASRISRGKGCKILDEAVRYLRKPPSSWKFEDDRDFLGMAVVGGAFWYVHECLKKRPDLMVPNGSRPLLDYALHPIWSCDGFARSYSPFRVREALSLLSAGASPDEPFEGSTVWVRFITWLAKRRGNRDFSPVVEEARKVIQSLLGAGADPEAEVLVHEDWNSPNFPTGPMVSRSAISILKEILPQESFPYG